VNYADLIIGLFFVASLIRGVELGFIQQACSTLGLLGGLLLGGVVQHHFIQPAANAESGAILSLLVVLGVAFIGLFVGELLGGTWKMRLRASSNQWLNKGDKAGGSAIAGVTLLTAVWLLTGLTANMPNKTVQQQVRSSFIIGHLNEVLPDAPKVLTRLSKLINPNGFPKVFVGREPALDLQTPLPNMGDLQAAVTAARPSVVKISGQGCGGTVSGSGFIAGQGLVITNAHVVAGVAKPIVVDGQGTHSAVATWFDPDLDIAVLRTDVSGKPLSMLAETAPNGAAAAVLGFPGGGDFTVSGATILDSFTATGRNIYDQGNVRRQVYSLKSDIKPGNSGGPLINKDGAVVGVIFAESTTYEQVGYALTMQEVLRAYTQAAERNQPVATDSCTAA
jgi:S1-C subfamily serine protease